MLSFGPVPSRRLGRSLGINNIPPKICTYSCVYCQLGRTNNMRADRQAFYAPEDIVADVRSKVEKAAEAGEAIDYLTFVPDGEPTQDINLGQEIDMLKLLGIKTAVICNSSLIWREDVREDLAKADWVSLKMDAVDEETWRKIDRPHKSLHLNEILEGALEFSEEYKGELVVETMLVGGINDSVERLEETGEFISRLAPASAYLSIPIRPPAEEWAQPPSEENVNQAYQVYSSKIENVEYLIGYEGNAFAFTGDVEEDLLSITAVHPMREDAVGEFLEKAGADWDVVQGLVEQEQLVRSKHRSHDFYLRKFRKA